MTSADAVAPWPPVTTEPVDWATPPALDGHIDPVTRARLEARPYRAAIAPPIAALDPVRSLPRSTLAHVADATRVMALFERDMTSLPVPLPAVLLRTESASSSQIEKLTANSRNIATAALGLHPGGNADAIAANASAMSAAMSRRGHVTGDGILAIHRSLLEAADPEIAGMWRTGQVWIGRPDLSPHGADFVSRVASRVAAAIADLVAFANRADVEGFVRATIAHAQFETIHPFDDGNGRTGRALVHVILRNAGYVEHSTVPVSAGLLADVDGYFAALTAYRAGDIAPIVEQFAWATQHAVVNGRILAAEVGALRERWRSALDVRRDSGAWRLLDAVIAQPVVNAAYVQRVLGSSDQGAVNAISALEAAGVLTRTSRDRRNRLWQAPEVLAAMDAFARRAGRRVSG